MKSIFCKQNSLKHENQKNSPPELPDCIINIDDPERPRIDKNISNELSNKYSCKTASIKEMHDKIEPTNEPKPIMSETIEEINNERQTGDIGNNPYIILRVYDAYYGQPQYQQQPRYQQQQSQWFGGYGQNYGPAPLAYDPTTRNYFVKFVLSIVFIMILLTAGFIAFVLATPDAKHFFRTHGLILMLPALIILLICHYAMFCSPCARVPPCNFIVLVITVMALSVLAAKVSAHYRTEVVLYGTIATAAVVFVCVILACSNFDFTSWLLYVVVISTAFAVIAMIILATMLITGTVMKPLIIVILVVGTLIEVVMLTIELQMILGGKSIELSEDDYALGAFMLYTSIMSLFMKLVQLIGLADT